MASKNPRSFGEQHTNIAVLDTETGNEVRTVEVTGIVLGHALTNNSLAVETAENFYPADTGKLDVFSLTNPQEKPNSIRTNRWLAGATSDSLLMSQQDPEGSYDDSICTLTTLSTTGEEEDTIAGVAAIHPGGWVERFRDPAVAIQEPGVKQPQELINVDTKASMDISDMSVDDVILPTGPGLLLEGDVRTEQGAKEVRVGWM